MNGIPKEFTDAGVLYLVKNKNEWPVYVCASEDQAIGMVKGDERLYIILKVVDMEYERLSLQREIVREKLVPLGTQEKE